MRVGLVIYGSLDTLSGGYLYDRQLVAHLQAHGHPVTVLSVPWRNYPRHLADNADYGWFRRLLDAPVDVLVQDELNHPSLAWLNRQLRRHTRVPLVALVHHLRSSERHPAPLRRLYRAVEQRYLTGVDGFICNSRTTLAAVRALVPARRAVVAYPGADRFEPTPTPTALAGGPLRLIFVGNIIPRKGLHTLLDAVALLADVPLALTIVGDWPPTAYARRLRARLADATSPTHALRVLGRVADDQLAAELAAADVLVVPSSYEGFGIVYLEGMAFGLPALATTAGAAAEFVQHGQNGVLIRPNAPHLLAYHLRRLARHPALLAQMQANARATFRRHPGWDAGMAHARRFLETLVADGGTP